MSIAILIPAFDEPGALAGTLIALRDRASETGGVTVLLVDDGSERAIDPASLPSPTPSFKVVLARHAANLGQGAALETARQLALLHARNADAFVTMDADGQHRVEDAFALARAVTGGADVAFGNRFLGDSNVPRSRRVVLAFARWLERALTGLQLHDAHNGLRAFNLRALEALELHQDRMAHATEIKQRVARDASLAIVEVPVSVRYTPESLARGQRSIGAAVIVRDLVHQYLFGNGDSR